jgi:hypothetical protein
VWLVNWRESVWTPLTPCGTVVHQPAVHFTEPVSVRPENRIARANKPVGSNAPVQLYTIRGRTLALVKNVRGLRNSRAAGAYLARTGSERARAVVVAP